LLWAAGGVSSADGKLTYPTALDVRDIVIYAFTAAGAFRYVPAENAIVPVVAGDCRAATGMQPYVADASVNLVYVQDVSRWAGKKVPAEKIVEFGCVHAGAAAQNASLFAAARGWASVVRGSVDREAVAKLLGLGEDQSVLLAHSIGPKSKG
ncbi:MAG: nitroreductase family protein, partial [Pyramidobacter sp.]|nr:nitroreductase family protein [Pyramidobacter sp.]